mmetsp:Transcript_76668/g.222602  ORF Transcript_76668/g.222602 Transcript_76668/m.222602 type:complete len:175 (-) Transcript_76668:116-640(-)
MAPHTDRKTALRCLAAGIALIWLPFTGYALSTMPWPAAAMAGVTGGIVAAAGVFSMLANRRARHAGTLNEASARRPEASLDVAQAVRPTPAVVERLCPGTIASGASLAGASDLCCVCLATMLQGQRVRRLPCTHSFHASCIDGWWMRKAAALRCPLCRALVSESALIEGGDASS